MNRTLARPLALIYIAVIVYASLFPFSGWRDQGLAPWAFLAAPLPKYWTRFDLISNVLGYLPLGFLMTFVVLRARAGASRGKAMIVGSMVGAALSFLMEATQSYLPVRVPSNLDFALNLLGAVSGALLAGALERQGATARWSEVRDRWFLRDRRGGLVLLALWPVALLYPITVPMGLGGVLERLESTLAQWLQETPFLHWLPVREVEMQPLVPGVEMFCVMLGVLVPCLLAHSLTAPGLRRALMTVALVATGVAATALSSALSFGPAHSWAWLTLPGQIGLSLALLFAGHPDVLIQNLALFLLLLQLRQLLH